MAEEHSSKSHDYEATTAAGEGGVEAKDRGLFDFVGKKEEEKPQEEVIASQFEEKVQVSEPEQPKTEEEVKDRSLLDKLRRSDSSSSSSSDEEEDEEKKKKKKEKKGLKEKIKEKISGDKEEEKKEEHKQHHEDTTVPVEVVHTEAPAHPEEKKGFLEKIKEKLPGGQSKKTEEVSSAPPPPPPPAAEVETSHTETASHEAEPKKGILEKIKEKLPGYHPKTEEEKEKEKEKEKESASH
ncbi:hypothetical protein Tsubulata_014213 [Turnera subulata]|uniref:Dehydrin n=1 Tax=Turnera subulata TaxID=218843 RepID=A0A9Q0JAB8_9ROSI|nr:hypothetical protein Tsubulata_014213 [Turnera subulata]